MYEAISVAGFNGVPSTRVVGADHDNVADPVVAAVTVSEAVPDMLPDVAMIVVEPAATEVTRPFDPAVLLMAATDAADELQVTAAVRFWVEPSEYAPVAVNCFVVPNAMLELDGVTAKETSVAGVTVSVVDPDRVLDVAVIVEVPAARQDARPLDPAALLIADAAVLDELHVTELVMFSVVPSEYVPVAAN